MADEEAEPVEIKRPARVVVASEAGVAEELDRIKRYVLAIAVAAGLTFVAVAMITVMIFFLLVTAIIGVIVAA